MAPRRLGPKRIAALLVGSAIVLAGCGTENTNLGFCGVARVEPLAPDSLVHVLPGADAEYLTDPPTSGPHQPWTAPAVIDRELTPAEQVGILETGDILVQYRPQQTDEERLAEIIEQLPPGAHVAPNNELEEVVVMTAWLTKQRCQLIDLDSIVAFTAEHRDQAPGHE